jgi:chemotaxis protein MotB
MALARRTSSMRDQSLIWPGFVDGLATLLMVIIFVLMVFFLIQINLAQRVSGQDATLQQLRGEIASLAELLNIEKDETSRLSATILQLKLQLDDAFKEKNELSSRIASLSASLDTTRQEKASLEDTLRALTEKSKGIEDERDRLTLALEALTVRAEEAEKSRDELTASLSEAIRRAELAETSRDQAVSQLDEQALVMAAIEAKLEELRLKNAEREAQLGEKDKEITATRQEIQILTQSVNALKTKLGQLQALLDEKEEEAREAKEVSVNLTKQLNNALSSKVAELQRFRSEFFGRLREVLKDRSDIRIVGDRFVFQSEVLFELGSADIGDQGEKQLMDLSNALREISNAIPTDIDWVLQVTGHTDNLPISTPRFRDNWDLSTERALSVVRYLILAGMEPERLSASGFGEFQPIDKADPAEARAKNRRIELKLTHR